jgi:predicted permease
VSGIVADLHFAARNLLRAPGFALMVVLTLALGIGATTGLFGVLRAVVLQPLPYALPDRLVQIGHLHAERGPVFGAFSPQDFDDLAAGNRSLADAAAYAYWPGQTTVNAMFSDGPQQLEHAVVSRDFFATLGVNPLLGRTFSADESRPGGQRAVVLSADAWRRFFAADPNVIGRSLVLDGDAYSVVGVMPDGFAFPDARVQAWLPMPFITEAKIPHRRDVRWLDVVGRLAPNVALDGARADLDRVLGRLEHDFPDADEGWGHAVIVRLQDAVVGNARQILLLSLLAAALVLATACVNVANGLLARGSTRLREFALRGALGARRSRLLRQLLFEALLLALAGGALGLLLALAALRVFAHTGAALLPRDLVVHPDPLLVAGVALLSIVVALGCGLAPALRATAGGLQQALGSRSGDDGPRGSRLRALLVVVQVGLVSMLLYAALLTFASLQRLAHVDPGIRTAGVLSFNVKFQGQRYDAPGARAQARDAILANVRALPGVVSAAGAKTFPLGVTGERYGFTLVERPQVAVNPEFGALIVSDGYFTTLGIAFERGRDFSTTPTPGRHEIIVNRALADQYWPHGDALGQRLRFGTGSDASDYEIIGVVGNVRHGKLWQDPRGAVYVSTRDADRSSFTVLVRSAVPAAAMFAGLEQAVHAVDPQLPLANAAAVRSALDDVLQRPRLLSALLAAFAAVATCIAAVGIFGVLAYVVGQRRRELAVRIALGARPAQMLRAVLRQGIVFGFGGCALGLAAAVLVALALRSLLFGVSPLDGPALVAVLGGVLGVCSLASLLPAQRAARVDPNEALREQ